MGHGADGPPPGGQDWANSRQGLRARTNYLIQLPSPPPTINPLSILKRRAYVDFQAPRDKGTITGSREPKGSGQSAPLRLKIYRERTLLVELPVGGAPVSAPSASLHHGACPNTASTAPVRRTTAAGHGARRLLPTLTTRSRHRECSATVCCGNWWPSAAKSPRRRS